MVMLAPFGRWSIIHAYACSTVPVRVRSRMKSSDCQAGGSTAATVTPAMITVRAARGNVEAAQQADARDAAGRGQQTHEGQQRQQVAAVDQRLSRQEVEIDERKHDRHRPAHPPRAADGAHGAEAEAGDEQQEGRPLHAAREVLEVGQRMPVRRSALGE